MVSLRKYRVNELAELLDKSERQIRNYIYNGFLVVEEKLMCRRQGYTVTTKNLQDFYDNYYNNKRFENKKRTVQSIDKP